jgi:DNA primase
MPIEKEEIERVKEAIDIVSFIRSRGVKLTRKGKQYIGLCPFHNDHDPSLIVDSAKQLWNCLGACRIGGDIYRYVMKADNVDFPKAHQLLIKEAGPQLAKLRISVNRGHHFGLIVGTVSEPTWAPFRSDRGHHFAHRGHYCPRLIMSGSI